MFGLEKIFFSFLPVPVSLLIYQKYLFKDKSKLGTYFDAFLYGILQGAFLLLAFPWIEHLLSSDKKILTGFISAALFEKLSAFIFLLFIFKKQYKNLRIDQYIFFGMFLGIGFSALENIFYSIQINSSMIFLRLFSSVPLHITTCGMIGYFIGLSEYYNSNLNKNLNLFYAFLFPFLFHGIYDSCLLLGEKNVYFIGLELVFLILILEYLIAKGISNPSYLDLANDKISLEGFETIQLQPQYERWIINSMGKKNAEFVPFFFFHITLLRLIFISILILIVIIFLFFQNQILDLFHLKLTDYEKFSLFVIYPSVFAINLFLLGAINPEYFKNSIIRIPIIMEVNILNGSEVKSVIGSEITLKNSFLKTFDTIGLGNELEISYMYSNYTSPPIKGKIVWENHEDFEKPMGSLIDFNKLDKGFIKFILFYYLFKLGKGILYNIHFPGFEKIRKLFVKESTVMEADNYFTSGTILFKEGEEGTKFYLLKKGNVEICKYTDSGKKITLTILESGDIFGEMAVVGDQARAATAICMTNCIVATADGENLQALIRGNPDFSMKLIKSLANRITSSENLMKKKVDELEIEYKMYKSSVEMMDMNRQFEQDKIDEMNALAKSSKISKKKSKKK